MPTLLAGVVLFAVLAAACVVVVDPDDEVVRVHHVSAFGCNYKETLHLETFKAHSEPLQAPDGRHGSSLPGRPDRGPSEGHLSTLNECVP